MYKSILAASIAMLKLPRHDLENLVQIYFSATNQRMNDIMRVLTIASVIFLPLNLLAGIYGMNDYMPGLNEKYGFFFVLFGMVGVVLFILAIFRWKKWVPNALSIFAYTRVFLVSTKLCMSTAAFKPLAIAILTISDSRTLAQDTSGQLLVR